MPRQSKKYAEESFPFLKGLTQKTVFNLFSLKEMQERLNIRRK